MELSRDEAKGRDFLEEAGMRTSLALDLGALVLVACWLECGPQGQVAPESFGLAWCRLRPDLFWAEAEADKAEGHPAWAGWVLRELATQGLLQRSLDGGFVLSPTEAGLARAKVGLERLLEFNETLGASELLLALGKADGHTWAHPRAWANWDKPKHTLKHFNSPR